MPEVPTILMEGGATYPGLEGGHRLIAFEAALIRLQLQMEESFLTIARSLGKPTIVLMDRGSVDICAYLMPKDWLATLSALGGLTTTDLFSRYHQVIHLVTAADGAESFYQLRYLQCVCMRTSLPFFVSPFLPYLYVRASGLHPSYSDKEICIVYTFRLPSFPPPSLPSSSFPPSQQQHRPHRVPQRRQGHRSTH